MEKIWESYTWDPDAILARHELRYDRRWREIIEETTPINYPDWSEERWQWEWHRHRKYLKEKNKREEANMVIKSTRLWVLVAVLQKVSETKILVEKNKQEASQILLKIWWSASKLKSFYSTGNNNFSSQETDSIISWIVHYRMMLQNPRLRWALKKLYKEIVKDMHAELRDRGEEMDFVAINNAYIWIPQDKKDRFMRNLQAITWNKF